MEPVTFNGKTYDDPRKLLFAVFRYLPNKFLGLLYIGAIVRLVKLQRTEGLKFIPPVWFCEKCGVTSVTEPFGGICDVCGNVSKDIVIKSNGYGGDNGREHTTLEPTSESEFQVHTKVLKIKDNAWK